MPTCCQTLDRHSRESRQDRERSLTTGPGQPTRLDWADPGGEVARDGVGPPSQLASGQDHHGVGDDLAGRVEVVGEGNG